MARSRQQSWQQSGRAVAASGLTVERGGQVVLSDLSLAVGGGELLLLRGPNGSGKSTLLLALAGLLPIQSGSVDWKGSAERRTDTILVGHAPAVKTNLTVGENLAFWAKLYGGSAARVAGAAEAAGLGHLLDIAAAYLSAGQTRRLSLARLLVVDRPVWLLDEPTSALDTEGAIWIAGAIAGQLARGGIVIAATHDDLPPIEAGTVKTLRLGLARTAA